MQTAVRKGNLRRILIVVGIVLVLAIIGTLVYLFGIDMKRDRYYQPEVSQVRLAHILDELKQPTRMGFETFTVEERGREGIYCIAAMDDLGREEVEGGPTTIQQFAGQYNQYLVFPAQDIEMEIEDVQYVPLWSSWDRGQPDYRGNLYAEISGEEEAAGKPNYRRQFLVTLRIGENYYTLRGFCKSDSFYDFLQEAVQLANENFGAAAAA